MKTKKYYFFPNLSHRVLLSIVVTLAAATVGYFVVDYGMSIEDVFVSLMVSFLGVVMFMFLLGIGFSITVPLKVSTEDNKEEDDDDDIALRRCMCFDPDDPEAPCLCNGPKTK